MRSRAHRVLCVGGPQGPVGQLSHISGGTRSGEAPLPRIVRLHLGSPLSRKCLLLCSSTFSSISARYCPNGQLNETSVTSVTSTTSVTSRGLLPLHHRGTLPDGDLHLPEPEKPPACGAGIAGTPDPSGQHRVEAIPKHGKTWQGSEGSDPERESTGASAPGRAPGSGILSVRSPNPEEAPRISEGPFATVRRQPDGGCSKCAVQGAGSLSPEVLMARLPVMNIDCRSNGISNGAGQDFYQLSLSLYPRPSLNLSLPNSSNV